MCCHIKKLLLLILILSGFAGTSEAQRIKLKKITKNELQANRCDFYPEAHSMILEKKGELSMGMNLEGLTYNLAEAVRIKILDAAHSDRGNVSILFYSPTSNFQYHDKISDIRGCTYNLEEGKIVETKLERSDIHRNRINDYFETFSFAMPAVKSGSVIEYAFIRESNHFLSLPDWHFQEDIPVCYNELNTIIPTYFHFNSRMLGNLQQIERDIKPTSVHIDEVTLPAQQTRLSVKNIPPVEEEPYVANLCDLPFRIEFILTYVDIPGTVIHRFASGYNQLGSALVNHDYFWKPANRGNFPRELKEQCAGKQGEELAAFLLDWWRNSVSWNGGTGIFSYQGTGETLKKGEGSVANINLGLNALFREFGLEANPVILSTRGNGMVHPAYPTAEDFNYVVSLVSMDGRDILCDATAKTPMGLLPPRCLNGDGYLITKEYGKMVSLKGNESDHKTVISTITLREGKLLTHILVSEKEYAALERFEEWKAGGEEEFRNNLKERYSDWKISQLDIKPAPDLFAQEIRLEKEQPLEEIIYIRPFLYAPEEQSPFKREERTSNVDFPYGSIHVVNTSIRVPDGYELEVPEAEGYMLEKKGGACSLNVLHSDNEYSLQLRVMLKQQCYTSDEYPELKSFFEKLAEWANSVVVLKKKR